MIDQIHTEEHEHVIDDLHVVCQHQRPDRGGEKPEAEHVAPLKQGMREKDDEGKIAERHELRAVSLAGEADHIRAEHERQRRDQRGGAREIPPPHQEEHEDTAEEVIHDEPRPRAVQIQEVEHPLDAGLHIAHVMRHESDVPERRHAAEKIRHPEGVHPLRLFNLLSGMAVTDGRCGVSLRCKGRVIEDDPPEDNQRHGVQQCDAEDVLHER